MPEKYPGTGLAREQLRAATSARGNTPIIAVGQALCIPRGVVHRFDSFGNEDVKQLAVISPAIMGPAYFREAAEVITAAAGGPPDREKMMDVFRRHGMTVAAPSLTPSN